MPTLKEKLALKEYMPIFADINRYCDDVGFVGDETTRLTLFAAIIRRKCIGIVSGSGSGKSAVTDAIMSLFDPAQVYTMESGSEKAHAYKHDEINSKDLIYLTELQKVGDSELAIEMLKNLGEGKEYNRDVVQPDKSVIKQTIKAGKAILYTKAIENKFESDAELDRRFPKLPTDITKQQNRRVIKSKANRRSNPFKAKKLDEKKRDALKAHAQMLLKESADDYTFINPLADFISEMIPDTFAISRTYTDHYLDFIEGIAYFNKANRIIIEEDHDGKKHKIIFVAPEDCWTLHKIYGEQFLQDVLNIPPNGVKIFDVFKLAKEKGIGKKQKSIFDGPQTDDRTKLTIHEIFNLLKESGIVLKENLIKKMLVDLMMGGYVHSDTTLSNNKSVEEYYLNEQIEEFHNSVDWDAAIKSGVETMKKLYPNYAQVYINKYCKETSFPNPFTGEYELVAPGASKIESDSTTIVIKAKPSTEEAVVPDSRDDWND